MKRQVDAQSSQVCMGITQVQADEIVKHKIITSENQEFSSRRADEEQRNVLKGNNAETDAVAGPPRFRAQP
jgi:hypothetical protein